MDVAASSAQRSFSQEELKGHGKVAFDRGKENGESKMEEEDTRRKDSRELSRERADLWHTAPAGTSTTSTAPESRRREVKGGRSPFFYGFVRVPYCQYFISQHSC